MGLGKQEAPKPPQVSNNPFDFGGVSGDLSLMGGNDNPFAELDQ